MRHSRLLVLLLVLVPSALFAQISPGPLSKAHADLEGLLGCPTCHSFAIGRPELKCLSCHMEIRDRLDNNRGYHSQAVDRQRTGQDCARCHAEHAGRSFNLIRWPSGIDKFDHRETGYELKGKHAAIQCAQCHKSERISSSRRGGILVKDLNRTFLGLDRTCLSCHNDPHRSELGSQCASCHGEDSWRPVRLFNHAKTRFALTGSHARVSCSGCHTPAPGSTLPASFKKADFDNCASCHRDVHSGGFKAACSTCHGTVNWRVTKTALSSRFDHSRTRYPLAGMHSGVACASCHKTADFGAPLKSEKCLDCHTDKHKGQFQALPDRGDCSGCHKVEGFKPATFDVAKHASTKYPLTGRHSAVACAKCHEGLAENTNYHPVFGACTDCHKDKHAGQFKARFESKCEACHDVNGFLPSTYTLARHGESRFTLAGSHLATACVDCHTSTRSAPDSRRYAFADTACIACHSDPHESEPGKASCETCHNVQSWKTLTRFDHDLTHFPLRGAHQITTCMKCHKPSETGASLSRRISFRIASTNCADCHEDIHAGQFRQRPGGSDCKTCHGVAVWRPSMIDHNDTKFPLDGAHRGVACAACHKASRTERVLSTLVYAAAPKECAACH